MNKSEASKENSSSWFLYVLLCSDNTLYTGITTDIKRRVMEHNSSTKGAKYTRGRRPVKVVYQEEHKDRSSASIAEHRFKKLNRREKEHYIGRSYG